MWKKKREIEWKNEISFMKKTCKVCWQMYYREKCISFYSKINEKGWNKILCCCLNFAVENIEWDRIVRRR